MRKDVKLYNVMFPIWFYFLFPQVWLIILVVNFIVDSLVVYCSAKRQQLPDSIVIWKKHILPVFLMGFVSDLIGAVLVFLVYLVYVAICGLQNPILFPANLLISLPGVVLAGWMIYVLNKKMTFRESDLDPAVIHRFCLHLALFTAPYTMLIPAFL
jgi:hypothetical protein